LALYGVPTPVVALETSLPHAWKMNEASNNAGAACALSAKPRAKTPTASALT
jgi:hypothetical protein